MPEVLIFRLMKELRISETGLQKIMYKDFKKHAFKIQLTQELKPVNHYSRRFFADRSLKIMRLMLNINRKSCLGRERISH